MFHESDELVAAYMTQLRSEHRRVQQCLMRVERQWQRWHECSCPATDVDEMLTSLAALRAELADHFAEEEAGGCLEEAVDCAPQLGRAATELSREAPELINRIDGLIGALKTRPTSMKNVETKYRKLSQEICEYEAAENRIVAEGFGMTED